MSPAYFEPARYTREEWSAAMVVAHFDEQKLVPVRIAGVDLDGRGSNARGPDFHRPRRTPARTSGARTPRSGPGSDRTRTGTPAKSAAGAAATTRTASRRSRF